MKVHRKKCTIAVCTFNRSAFLEKILASLKKQTYLNFDILVIDNASTDNTKAIAEKYNAKYIFEKKQGIANARNAAIENSDSHYLAFLDDDETVDRDWLENMINALENYNAAMATGPVLPVYEKQPPDWMPLTVFEDKEIMRYKKNEKPFSLANGFSGTGNSIFLKSIIGKERFKTNLGRKGKSLISGEDSEFIARLFTKSGRALFVPGSPIYHFIPSDRTTFIWLTKRAFAEGVTEYRMNGVRILLRRIHKPILDLFALVFSLFTFNRKKLCQRWLRLSQSCGVVFGWGLR
ncbi:MAG: glycosyltransferase family 2 protein [Bacillota bacterium]